MHISSREQALALDATDPLAAFKGRFRLPQGITYLVGHSLGPVSESAIARLNAHAQGAWAVDIVGAWNNAGWIDLPHQLGARIAALIGVKPDSVIVCDSVSVNLFKLAAAALPLSKGPKVIRLEADEFPTDKYIAERLADLIGVPCEVVAPGAGVDALLKGGVFIRSAVNYRTSELANIEKVEEAARASGALVIWDLSHATGLIDLDLAAKGGQLAVGCTYKYLNGGPGAPAFLYATKALCEQMATPLPGWLGHRTPFDFDSRYQPAEGITRFLAGTPPILALAALEGALDLFEEVDLSVCHRKAMALGDLCLSYADELGLSTLSPPAGQRRGGHISLQHEKGYEIVQALAEKGRKADFRAPETIRLGFSPLFLSYADVWDTMEDLAAILNQRLWDRPHFAKRGKVT